jgi:hypothetical protein
VQQPVKLNVNGNPGGQWRTLVHCRHLVGDRLDITGARWGLQGAEAALKLRALSSNGDFPGYWRYHLAQEHRRVHQARYQHPLAHAA